MACGLALKRPHNFGAYLTGGGEDGGASEAKRARPTCSPFRPQLGTIAASLPSCSKLSPFHEASARCHLTTPELENYLRAEVRNLRKRKLIPRRLEDALNSYRTTDPLAADKSNYANVPGSPPSSDSEGEGGPSSGRRPSISCTSSTLAALKRQADAAQAAKNHQAKSAQIVAQLQDKSMFTLTHVRMIVERLLREQEQRLRTEFESVLQTKLDEQHDAYCQMLEEQAKTTTKSSYEDLSYLS